MPATIIGYDETQNSQMVLKNYLTEYPESAGVILYTNWMLPENDKVIYLSRTSLLENGFIKTNDAEFIQNN
ncbi:hypothetical protein [Aquella oligotrophica]|uniref:Uncharacterized protein n=1 Tax=Aquella oligotrophica TaxID=2067065 RepID=A0A2I7N6T9_9NEIS|nr:hypothetical protein [Aquella oligotrophica]AUR52169.1 hypothetical protein CUN60_07605 [Aquella oligotrophica]